MKQWLVIVALAVIGCHSHPQADAEVEVLDIEVYYIEEIGGTPNSGISRKYFITFYNCPEDSRLDSLCLNEQCLPVKPTGERQWQAVAYIAQSQLELWPADASATLRMIWSGKPTTLRVDNFYLKERVVMP